MKLNCIGVILTITFGLSNVIAFTSTTTEKKADYRYGVGCPANIGPGSDLRECDFFYANLEFYDLRGANLSGANLRQTNLNGADLRGANLSNTYLTMTYLNGANLEGANLESAQLNRIKLNNANLSGANLNSAILINAVLNSVNLNGADLRGANLSDAELTMTDLYGANLSGAILESADLDRIKLHNVNLSGANLISTELTRAVLNSVNLSGADLRGTKLYYAELKDVNLRNADLRDVKLRGAKLVQVDLSGADLQGAILNNVTWLKTTLPNGNIRTTNVLVRKKQLLLILFAVLFTSFLGVITFMPIWDKYTRIMPGNSYVITLWRMGPVISHGLMVCFLLLLMSFVQNTIHWMGVPVLIGVMGILFWHWYLILYESRKTLFILYGIIHGGLLIWALLYYLLAIFFYNNAL